MLRNKFNWRKLLFNITSNIPDSSILFFVPDTMYVSGTKNYWSDQNVKIISKSDSNRTENSTHKMKSIHTPYLYCNVSFIVIENKKNLLTIQQ